VVNFLVARYGEFLLLRPPLTWHTAALWGLPPVVLLIGIVAIVVIVRRRRNAPIPPPANLTAAEESRLSELMREG
jgi:cytochrome c-type biogenesis protein CcmH